MLRYLRVRDLAVFKEAACELGPGLCLITGETGAGKSLLVDAIGLLVGERASSETVRSGESSATVEGIFDLTPAIRSLLDDLGFPHSGDELVLRRILQRGGRSRAFINDTPATVETLRSLGELLVEIHGQHAHQALLRPEVHRQWVDAAGGLEEVRGAVERAYFELKEVLQLIEEAETGQEERAQRLEFLEFQIAAIQQVSPEPGESDRLKAEAGTARNREQILLRGQEAIQLLREDEGAALLRAGQAHKAIEEVSRLTGSAEISELSAQLQEGIVLLQEAAGSMARFLDGLDANPSELDRIEQRLSDLDRLERRHGGTVESVLQFLDDAIAERDRLASLHEGLGPLRARREDCAAAYVAAAERLHQERLRLAPRLGKSLEKEIAALEMEGARCIVEITPREQTGSGIIIEGREVRPGADGTDRVEFLFSPNRGETPRPLRKIASGGELSRVMLALRTCLPPPQELGATLVFDEVDAGVSGTAGGAVGDRLRGIAQRDQVLCVTHLPQIAAQAQRHFAVRKRVEGKRTVVDVTEVEGSRRVEEIARMLGETPGALDHARKLVDSSKRSSKKVGNAKGRGRNGARTKKSRAKSARRTEATGP